MSETKVYKTASGAELKVRVCDKHGNPIAEGTKMELPELREFLTRVYSAQKPLAEGTS